MAEFSRESEVRGEGEEERVAQETASLALTRTSSPSPPHFDVRLRCEGKGGEALAAQEKASLALARASSPGSRGVPASEVHPFLGARGGRGEVLGAGGGRGEVPCLSGVRANLYVSLLGGGGRGRGTARRLARDVAPLLREGGQTPPPPASCEGRLGEGGRGASCPRNCLPAPERVSCCAFSGDIPVHWVPPRNASTSPWQCPTRFP